MSPSVRKLLGSLALFAYMITFIAIAADLGGRVLGMNAAWWMQLVYFACAGIIWALPLKPLFNWMNGLR